MDLLLTLNNASSFALMLACWWLAHSYVAAGFPYGKPIAAGWGIVGFSVMATALARNLYLNPEPFTVTTKCVMCVLCVLIAMRVQKNREIHHELP